MPNFSAERPCRILSLDGGGAKGFYTLGVLREIEGLVGCRLHEKFDLIFGTSTGAIIASLLALGHSVEEIHVLYKQYVPIAGWSHRLHPPAVNTTVPNKGSAFNSCAAMSCVPGVDALYLISRDGIFAFCRGAAGRIDT